MLHITDGESVAGTLRESTVAGDVSTYGDLMFEGPAPGGLDAEAWRDTRARFMADAGYATPEEALEYLTACEETLAAFPQHEEVVIWLDHRLSDQLILIKVLDWFSRQDLGSVKLSLICVDRCAGVDPFIGLGALYANQLASLAGARVPVNEAQYRTASAAWNAFTSPDPTEIERFIQTDTSALPFIAASFRRHLEQFPSVEEGLSRTERQALSVLRERGPLSGGKLFVAVQRLEEQIFMGDGQFYRLIADLATAPHPLVQISDTPQNSLGTVSITETGKVVLEGRADHVGLNGIDRWIGGVHLKGDSVEWRWDRAAQRIVGY
jgi:hypothetical protein